MQQYPISTVGAAVFDAQANILLVKTHKWGGRYGLPGGKIELGERAEQALFRELKEETNLHIVKPLFVLYQDCVYSPEFYLAKHFIFLNYACLALNPEEVILNDEAQSFVWLDLEEALSQDLNTPTRQLLEHPLVKKYALNTYAE